MSAANCYICNSNYSSLKGFIFQFSFEMVCVLARTFLPWRSSVVVAPVPRQHVVLRPSPARTRGETHECLHAGGWRLQYVIALTLHHYYFKTKAPH